MAFSLEKLSTLNAVSGCEDEARDYIIPLIKDKCDSIEVDSIGNVIAFKKGIKSDYRILVGTNIDEVGFIVSEITDGGFTAESGPTTEYAEYLEYGTRFMDAQPFVAPSLEAQTREFQSDMQKLVR